MISINLTSLQLFMTIIFVKLNSFFSVQCLVIDSSRQFDPIIESIISDYYFTDQQQSVRSWINLEIVISVIDQNWGIHQKIESRTNLWKYFNPFV